MSDIRKLLSKADSPLDEDLGGGIHHYIRR